MGPILSQIGNAAMQAATQILQSSGGKYMAYKAVQELKKKLRL